MTKASELIAQKQLDEKLARERAALDKERTLRAEIASTERALRATAEALKQQQAVEAAKVARGARKKIPVAKRAATKHTIRVIIPDSHGDHIDPVAEAAFLADLELLNPDEIVMLGDHLDCGGTFNAHQRSYTNELVESYVEDVAAANDFLDAIRRRSPNAEIHYIEGNHEAHVERWAARNIHIKKDADLLVSVLGPEAQLKLKAREIRYYQTKEFYQHLSIPGTIKLGKCHFTHGISHSKHADSTHLERFNGNVVFGHVHRVLAVGGRTVTSTGHGAWCPGTLAKLQPLYKHTQPTTWQHGYGVQFCSSASGYFTHFNVPIFGDGSSGLEPLIGAVRARLQPDKKPA